MNAEKAVAERFSSAPAAFEMAPEAEVNQVVAAAPEVAAPAQYEATGFDANPVPSGEFDDDTRAMLYYLWRDDPAASPLSAYKPKDAVYQPIQTNSSPSLALPVQPKQVIYPTFGYEAPSPARDVRVSTQASPANIQAVYSITLQTIHQNANGNANSSAFVFTNTGTVAADYYLDLYWQNGLYDSTQGPYTLNPGESQHIDMGTSPFGANSFVGWIVISGNEPVAGLITTPDYAYITGAVYDTDGVTPIPNFWVSVCASPDCNDYGGGSSLSDGVYYAGGLPDGDYIVTANPSYPYAKQWYNGQEDSQYLDVVTISGGSHATGIDFVLQPGAKITGTVYAANGVTPLENINVDLSQGWYGTCTDANGYYEIVGVPYGAQVVRAGGDWNWCLNEQSVYIREYYSETNDYDSATLITVNASADIVADIDFSLDVGGVVKGQVTDSGGGPLSNVNISADEFDNNDFSYGTQTDSNGYYTITGLIAADYQIVADVGYPYARQYYNGHDVHWDADRVSIGLGDVFNADFALDPGGMITGYVYDSSGTTPLANISVYTRFSGACTDENGYYEIDGLPYGDELVFAGGGWNWCQSQDSIYIQEFYNGVYHQADMTPVNVSSSDDIAENINFTLDLGGVITGRVIKADSGLPMKNFPVDAGVIDGDFGQRGWTDANGYYTITGLIVENYSLEVHPGYPYAFQWYNNKDHGRQADAVSISSAGEVITGIDFNLQPGGLITGYVYADDGSTPLENINVDLAQGWYGTCTDANGYYEIHGVPYGEQVVQAGGDWNWCQERTSAYIREYYDETYSYDDAARLDINSDSDIYGDINFTMETGGSITGRITDAANGDPLADVYVDVNDWPNDQFGTGSSSDANGYYTVTGLIDGDYVVSVRNPEETPLGYGGQYYNGHTDFNDADVLTISGGNTVSNIDIALEAGGAITGVVVDQATGLPLANVKVGAGIRHQHFGFGVCTDSNGEFSIQGMPYADYVISAAEGWNWCLDQPSQHAVEFYDEKIFYNEADIVTIDSGSRYLGEINFTLEAGGYITGTVVDASTGLPVPNLQIKANVHNGDCPWCYDTVVDTETNSDGQYILGPLPGIEVGVYACADCSGILLVSEFYSDAYDIQAAEMISVPAGATISDINFTLDPGIWITGNVSVPAGYSAEDIQIDVWKWDGFQYNTGCRTDSNGDYIVPVPPIYDSYWAVSARPYNTDLGFQWAHGFDLQAQTQWDFDLEVGGVITGHLTADGTPLANVWVTADSDWMNDGTNTDSNGYFEITNLPPGTYRLEAGGDWQGRMRTFYGGHDWDWATLVQLDLGETKGGYTIEVPELGQLEGHVYEMDGVTPVEGVRVTAMNATGFWQGWSQVDGYFSVDLPAGEHKVRFDMENWDIYPVYYQDSRTHSDGLTVTVPAVDASLYISQTVGQFASLSGHVSDAVSGAPVGGIQVAVSNVDPVTGRMSNDGACTDETGDYYIEKFWPGGDVLVTAVGTCGGAENYATLTTTLHSTVPGGAYTLDLSVTSGPAPKRPFTVRSPLVFDITPLSSSYGNTPNDTDQILPALFTPIAQLDDQGEWYSELLTQIPTVANGGVRFIDGQMVMTYTLKSGLLWSDGEALTSSDIRFTWQLLTVPSLVLNQGIDAYRVEQVYTPDAQTAVLVFEEGFTSPNYPQTLLYLMPEHILQGEHSVDIIADSYYAHFPVGNGPYVVDSWVPRSHIDLRANPNYHKRSLGYPKIEKIRFLFNQHPFWSLIGKDVDVSLNIDPGTIPDDISSWDLQFYTGAASYDNIYLNPETPFFSDAAVRLAMYQALDRQTFVDYRGRERIVAESWLPTNHLLYTDTITTYDFDLTAAANRLTAAGWVDTNANGTRDKDGVEFEFDLYFPDGHEARTFLVTMFQEDLESIGVNVNLIPSDWGSLIDRGWRGLNDAFTVGFGLDALDPGGYDFFHSVNIPTAYNSYRPFNASRWNNTANDALVEAISGELDLAAFKHLYGQQLVLYNTEMPALTHSHWAQYFAAIPTLLNFEPDTMRPTTWNIENWELPANPYDLSVRKYLTEDSSPRPGNVMTYVINVRNGGYFSMTNVTLEDTLPNDVNFVSADPVQSSLNGDKLTWNLGEIQGNSPVQIVKVRVEVPGTVVHGTMLTNTVEVYGDQLDTRPQNNGFVHLVEVREDVDLAITKSGIGYPAIGEKFRYSINYANWGGAPASGAVVTDTLPPQVTLLSANPAPSSQDGNILTWNLPTLAGNKWGGKIQINVDIVSSGTVTNTADIGSPESETTYANNTDDHVDFVNEILNPVILRPTQGTVDQTPTISGLAPSSSVVNLYEMTNPGTPIWVMSTTATVTGTFSVELNLTEGTYILAATATKAGLTSSHSETATFDVDHDLPLDPDYVTITADGVDMSAGAVRANKYTLARRLLNVQARLSCATGAPTNVHLDVTENGTFYYTVPLKNMTNLGGDAYEVEFQFWMGNPHSTYDVWIEWKCNGETKRENLMYILIDPDGYLYDQSLVDAGSTITDSILLNGIITAYVRMGDEWAVWPAYVYGQTNPQLTDSTTDDGVIVAGYYSFLTPPGQYYLEATAPGYQPYQSEILTVIDEVIHLDIGLEPVTGGSGFNKSPVDLRNSEKTVDQSAVRPGETLTYQIVLDNSGDDDTGLLSLSDSVPTNTTYVDSSLTWSSGTAQYISASDTITWTGRITGRTSVTISFQVTVDFTRDLPGVIENTAQVSSNDTNLTTLTDLQAFTSVQAWSAEIFLPLVIK